MSSRILIREGERGMSAAAWIRAGGAVGFELEVMFEGVEICVFEGQLNSAKDFASGDVDCPSDGAAFDLWAQLDI